MIRAKPAGHYLLYLVVIPVRTLEMLVLSSAGFPGSSSPLFEELLKEKSAYVHGGSFY